MQSSTGEYLNHLSLQYREISPLQTPAKQLKAAKETYS